MYTYLFKDSSCVTCVLSGVAVKAVDLEKLEWLLSSNCCGEKSLKGVFIGPRREMVTPWSTNATEISQNVGIDGIIRMERFELAGSERPLIDRMLQQVYQEIGEGIFDISTLPEPVIQIDDIGRYNIEAGLALSAEEIAFLEDVQQKLGRLLTDCEVYGFAQVNSEHCRHKIFNGTFIVDGEERESSLFELIKLTTKESPAYVVSAYKDNVAFICGPRILRFAPHAKADGQIFEVSEFDSVISIKAETHNFPTTVEPFYGASTGSGGEIRDRMAGGIGGIPLAGSAVYMTAYPRLREGVLACWEQKTKARKWKYQTPQEILTKASNGASDFGNKFGQPLIVGSMFTFEGYCGSLLYGFDRTVMLAGGVGFAERGHAQKKKTSVGDKVVLLGGDNYRIGMAGGSVSSVGSGEYSEALELSAVQRANPEMQKRVFNVIRTLAESPENPIKSVHDHGAGGHMNCFGELLEEQGGSIVLSKLPIGDPTLSAKEIICNESQERMGLVVSEEAVEEIRELSERERAPFYVVGEISGSGRLVFEGENAERPVDLPAEVIFSHPPKTVISDATVICEKRPFRLLIKSAEQLGSILSDVLSLEGVACKDWLTNKVDRSVTGLIALQQCVGPLQLPLADCGVVSLDYRGLSGAAMSVGHAPAAGLIDADAGSVLSIAEALTNIVWAPLSNGISSVVLSANWMWPAKQPGEDARLYRAVEAASRFARELGISIPTGKDSLSMTMNYADGQVVRAPGTVIISAVAETSDVRLCVTPDLKPVENSQLVYIDLSGLRSCPLGGSSAAQVFGELGDTTPTVGNPSLFKKGLEIIQQLVIRRQILAGHDISSGGMLGCACEMAFCGDVGFELDLRESGEEAPALLFCEKPSVLMQIADSEASAVKSLFESVGLRAQIVGRVGGSAISVTLSGLDWQAPVSRLRQVWFEPSYLLEQHQTSETQAKQRRENVSRNRLFYVFPPDFSGRLRDYGVDLERRTPSGIRAAIVREKGTNGDREMAFSLFAAGFDVKDVTMTDLMSGRETLEDVSFVVFPGGFSNSDVLGAGRGWAGVFRYNEQARQALSRFYLRSDTLSLGVCNGCQLMVALDLLYPEHPHKAQMLQNESKKFESAFVNVVVEETESVLLKGLSGSRLGIWVAHGEGRFSLPENRELYDIPLSYAESFYPANPNGSDCDAAAICSRDGRHLAIMPHLERSIFPWQWPYMPRLEWQEHEVCPWMLAFVNAREWLRNRAP